MRRRGENMYEVVPPGEKAELPQPKGSRNKKVTPSPQRHTRGSPSLADQSTDGDGKSSPLLSETSVTFAGHSLSVDGDGGAGGHHGRRPSIPSLPFMDPPFLPTAHSSFKKGTSESPENSENQEAPHVPPQRANNRRSTLVRPPGVAAVATAAMLARSSLEIASSEARGRSGLIRVSSTLQRTKSMEGKPGAANISVTQVTPTALPQELINLSRSFRAAVEHIAANPSVDVDEAKKLHQSSNDILRYVSGFLMQHHEQEHKAANRRALGWKGAKKNDTAGSTAADATSGGGDKEDLPSMSVDNLQRKLERARRQSKMKRKSVFHNEHGLMDEDVPNTFSIIPSEVTTEKKASTSTVNAAVLGPFVFTAIYGVMEALLHTIRADRGTLWINDAKSNELVSMVLVGSGDPMHPLRIPNVAGVAGSVYRTGISVNVLDTERVGPKLFTRTVDDATGYYTRNIISFPIFRSVSDYDERTSADEAIEKLVVKEGQDNRNYKNSKNVIGVIQFLNKSRLAGAAGGFSPEDEVSLHHHARSIAAMLQWGGGLVDYCGATAEDESHRMQVLLSSQQAALSVHRHPTNAGCKAMTKTESLAQQQRQKDIYEKQQHVATRAMLIEHPLLAHAKRVVSGPTLVLRAGTHEDTIVAEQIRSQHSSTKVPSGSGLKGEADRVLAVENEVSGLTEDKQKQAARDRDVRDVALFLERIEQSWKSARETCLVQEEHIRDLKARARRVEQRYRALQKMCTQCGIVADDGEATTEFLDKDEDLDDDAFHRRLDRQLNDAVQHQTMAAAFEAKVAEQKVKQSLDPIDQTIREKEAAAASESAVSSCIKTSATTNEAVQNVTGVKGAEAMEDAQEINKEFLKRLKTHEADVLRRVPLVGRTKQEHELAGERLERVEEVREQLKKLMMKHRDELDELSVKHRGEVKDLHCSIAAQDKEIGNVLSHHPLMPKKPATTLPSSPAQHGSKSPSMTTVIPSTPRTASVITASRGTSRRPSTRRSTTPRQFSTATPNQSLTMPPSQQPPPLPSSKASSSSTAKNNNKQPNTARSKIASIWTSPSIF